MLCCRSADGHRRARARARIPEGACDHIISPLIFRVCVCSVTVCDNEPLSFRGWPTMSAYKWKRILTLSHARTRARTHTRGGLSSRTLSDAVCCGCVLTFRVIWKVSPHLAASASPPCHHGNTNSRDNTRPVRGVARRRYTAAHAHEGSQRARHCSSLLHFVYPSFLPFLLS